MKDAYDVLVAESNICFNYSTLGCCVIWLLMLMLLNFSIIRWIQHFLGFKLPSSLKNMLGVNYYSNFILEGSCLRSLAWINCSVKLPLVTDCSLSVQLWANTVSNVLCRSWTRKLSSPLKCDEGQRLHWHIIKQYSSLYNLNWQMIFSI